MFVLFFLFIENRYRRSNEIGKNYQVCCVACDKLFLFINVLSETITTIVKNI